MTVKALMDELKMYAGSKLEQEVMIENEDGDLDEITGVYVREDGALFIY